jgi:hypothetical protein
VRLLDEGLARSSLLSSFMLGLFSNAAQSALIYLDCSVKIYVNFVGITAMVRIRLSCNMISHLREYLTSL